MGSDPAGEHVPDDDEAPRHRVRLPGFRISHTPVTNAEYGAFVRATGHPAPGHWPEGWIPGGTELHPVTYVSWDDARAFCTWAGCSLPTEAQWERAARGDDDRLWPWGNLPPAADRANFADALGGPCDVGRTPLGASPCGALGLAGNVWEWTASLYRPYPYAEDDGREAPDLGGARVVRGGSFIHGAREIRCSYRHGMLPGVRDPYVGFRVCGGDGSARQLDWAEVPAGEVRLGNDPRAYAGPALAGEVPLHEVDLPGFELSLTPVTNAQYARFVRATGHPDPGHWSGNDAPAELAEHPVTHVDWLDARAFCGWAGGRLPTEAEWEKAARSDDGRLYPWGATEPGGDLLTFARGSKEGSTTPVGAYPLGASPYGALDMAGNVWEWVGSVYRAYPYRHDDGREDPRVAEPRVLRGGSYASPGARWVRCASRSRSYPSRRQAHIGFRVARGDGRA